MRLIHALFAATLLIASLPAAPADGTTSTQCGPGDSGSPCGGAGVASLGNTSGTNQGAGNPINVITGNKYQMEVDLPALPGVLGLEIVRHYNSAQSGEHAPNGILGRGWRLSYETDLYAIGNTLEIVQADGTRIIFVRDPGNPSQCASNDPARGKVTITRTPRGEEYLWTWPNGRILRFNHQGKLLQIQAPTGEFVTLTRDPAGLLMKVTDPQGRSLILGYPQHRSPDRFNGVVSIDSPVGRFAYAYGSAAPKGYTGNPNALLANLSAVTFPDGVVRRYHYEDPAHPTFLTGISVQGQGTQPQRLSTWAYDQQGRGILSFKGEAPKPGQAGIEQVRLAFPAPGKTVLTNSLNQTTTYTHAIVGNEYRLLEVRGAGCASCGEANVRYGYDRLGRLTEETKLNEEGQPLLTTRTERDGLGRPVSISRIAYHNGRPQPAKRLIRYEYAGDSTQPNLIARPSVTAGREAITRIDYNAYGQPTRITESGFGPLDEQGQAKPTPISRTTTYTYRTINNRSVLAQIDGPLPNGPRNDPSDSDITRIEWDGRGDYMMEVMAPGNVLARVAKRDSAGRPIAVALSDGARMIQSTALLDTQGHVRELRQSAWLMNASGKVDGASQRMRIRKFDYDAQGNLINVVQPDGTTTRTERDGLGRAVGLLDSQNNRITYKLDTESQLIAWLSQNAKGDILNGRMYLRDQHNQLLAILTPQPAEREVQATQIAASGEQGAPAPRLALVERALDGVHVLTADGGVHHVFTGRSGAGYIDPAGRVSGVLVDDFDRVVLETNPDEGRISYVYRNGVIEKRQTARDGSRTLVERLAFDTAGRIIGRTRAGCTETLVYTGQLLKQVTGCNDAKVFGRDAFGLITEEIQTISKVDQTGNLVLRTTYRYDHAGRLIARGLPDGQFLYYRYDRSGNQQAVLRESDWLDLVRRRVSSSLADWMAAHLGDRLALAPVIDQLAWQPFNGPLISARAANGIKTSWRYDRAGNLIAIAAGDESGRLYEIRYQRDARGRILASTEQGRHVQSSQTTYTYDGVGRLTQASEGRAPQGALLRVSGTAASIRSATLAYTPLGRRQTPQPEYDNFGRQVQHIVAHDGGPAVQQLVWNDAHQLIKVKQAQRTLAEYRYDVQGNRIAKTVTEGGKTQTTYYQYDQQRRLVAELDQNGKVTAQYLYTGYVPYAVLKADGASATRTVYVIHADERGLPLQVTDEQARVVWQMRFDAWGNRLAANDSSFRMPLRLAGQVEDEETGLYYNVNRYYDAIEGRYLSPDPLGWMHGDERYAYANNDPVNGVDPAGLFEIPTFAFFGLDSIFVDRQLPVKDDGHGDIVRVAFLQYQQQNGFRFSQTIIDQIIINNYHSDANAPGCFAVPGIPGGGQCNAKNHFDNPNDGAVYRVTANGDGTYTLGEKYASYTNGAGDNWIMDSLNQIDANRGAYNRVLSGTGLGLNISSILNAFGQNTHALADFYAHTNWVDSAGYTERIINGIPQREYDRGGFFKEQISGGVFNAKYKCGWVPFGLGMTRVWDEAFDVVPLDNIFSGTVATKVADGLNQIMCRDPIHGDISCTADKSAHGYWNKDKDTLAPGEVAFTSPEQSAFAAKGMFFWQVDAYDPKHPPETEDGSRLLAYGTEWVPEYGKSVATLKKGDRIYLRRDITKRHRMAYYLAVEHTKQEIAKLYAAADGVKVGSLDLRDVFKMDAAQLAANGIDYTQLFSKQ